MCHCASRVCTSLFLSLSLLLSLLLSLTLLLSYSLSLFSFQLCIDPKVRNSCVASNRDEATLPNKASYPLTRSRKCLPDSNSTSEDQYINANSPRPISERRSTGFLHCHDNNEGQPHRGKERYMKSPGKPVMQQVHRHKNAGSEV